MSGVYPDRTTLRLTWNVPITADVGQTPSGLTLRDPLGSFVPVGPILAYSGNTLDLEVDDSIYDRVVVSSPPSHIFCASNRFKTHYGVSLVPIEWAYVLHAYYPDPGVIEFEFDHNFTIPPGGFPLFQIRATGGTWHNFITFQQFNPNALTGLFEEELEPPSEWRILVFPSMLDFGSAVFVVPQSGMI